MPLIILALSGMQQGITGSQYHQRMEFGEGRVAEMIVVKIEKRSGV
jgi:hypothetical protein